MDIKTNEIGDLLRSQIKNINESVDVNEVGEVLAVSYTHLTLPTM